MHAKIKVKDKRCRKISPSLYVHSLQFVQLDYPYNGISTLNASTSVKVETVETVKL